MVRQTEAELLADHERVEQLYRLQIILNRLWHTIEIMERSDEVHEGDGPALTLTQHDRDRLIKLKARYDVLEALERRLLRPGRLTDHPIIERRSA